MARKAGFSLKQPVYSLAETKPEVRARQSSRTHSGEQFQQDIMRSEAWYRARREATLVEVPSATRVIGKRQGKPVLAYADNVGIPDFVGSIMLQRLPTIIVRPVIFDAKVVTGLSHFKLPGDDPKGRRRTADQISHLIQCEEAGSMAGMLMLDRDTDRIYWLWATELEPLTSLQAISGFTDPKVPIRPLLRGQVPTGVRYPLSMVLPTDREIIAGQASPIPWVELLREVYKRRVADVEAKRFTP